jgi:DNA mismatch repair protein MutL
MDLPRILPLPDVLANQIAAGEVVERPASVLKELLENSLDAGARQLDVEAEGGGVRLLRVRDDGVGIHPEDLVLALARHATSKIRTLDDLLAVHSLGFRGEALPSIASVARLTLASRARGEEVGWRVRVEGGGPPVGPEPLPHPPGTTVEVRDLFYNVPARRKFVRGDRTELAYLEDVARRVALSRFEVGVRLRHDGRDRLVVRPATDTAGRVRRVVAVCGVGFLEQALEVEAEREDLRLTGWVGLPEAARSQADLQYVFLNGRAVRDRRLVHALREAYQDRVYPGRHPAYVLYVEVDPEQVDVNVHPTKQEVRFRDPRRVHDFLARSLGQVLAGVAPPAPVPLAPQSLAPPAADAPWASAAGCVAERVAGGYREPLSGGPTRAARGARLEDTPPAPASTPWRPLGVLHGRYLLVEGPRGLLVADARAIRSRTVRRELEAVLAGGATRTRPLLIPASLRVGPGRAQVAEDHRECWESLGFELVRTAPESVTLRRVPVAFAAVDPAVLVAALLEGAAGAPRGPCPPSALIPRVATLAAEAAAGEADLQSLARELGEHGPGPAFPGRELSLADLASLLPAPRDPDGGEG